jgi:hypothetical protein
VNVRGRDKSVKDICMYLQIDIIDRGGVWLAGPPGRSHTKARAKRSTGGLGGWPFSLTMDVVDSAI